MSTELKIIAGGMVKVLAVAAGCAAIQPVLADPEVFPVLRTCAQALALSTSTIGVVLAAGYANHKIMLWAKKRPVTISPAKLYAVEQEHGPDIAETVADLDAQEICTEDDDLEHQWHNMLTRFVVLGAMHKSFSLTAMHNNVRRKSWETLKGALIDAGVLRRGEGQSPTNFAEGWYCRRVSVSLERGILRPPLPDDKHWPEVKWFL